MKSILQNTVVAVVNIFLLTGCYQMTDLRSDDAANDIAVSTDAGRFDDSDSNNTADTGDGKDSAPVDTDTTIADTENSDTNTQDTAIPDTDTLDTDTLDTDTLDTESDSELPQLPFVSVWKTDNDGVSNNHQITLPLVETGRYDFTADWGDGTTSEITSFDDPDILHTYDAPGKYTVTINGTIVGWQFGPTIEEGAREIDLSASPFADELKLVTISNWGVLDFGDTVSQFMNCDYLHITATDKPIIKDTKRLAGTFAGCWNLDTIPYIGDWDVSGVTDTSFMFLGTNINDDIGGWNTSHITTMTYMFGGAKRFNRDIGHWDTSSVTDMAEMFGAAQSFNQDISSWDVSNVVNMSQMFHITDAFNQDLSDWDTSSVTDMSGMFKFARAFNGDIGAWNTSQVTTMAYMFLDAESFNRDIGNWNTSKVTTMEGMFSHADTFNQNIGSWDTTNVTTFARMFDKAPAFNADIGNWDTSGAISFHRMFFWATAFNGDIGDWDTAAATDMEYMFHYAKSFNQDIGRWDTSSVRSMNSMFMGAAALDQNLSSWDISSLQGAAVMFRGDTLATPNYDALLVGWASQEPLSDVTFDGGNSMYSPGIPQRARQMLIDVYNWTITDGGMITDSDTEPCYLGDILISSYGDLAQLTNKACIDGTLTVTSDTMTQLPWLEEISYISGSLAVEDSPLLTTFDSLIGLTAVDGGVLVLNLDALENVDGFGSLTSIGGALDIAYAPKLSSLEGLSQITELPNGWFDVWGLPLITDLAPFEGLTVARNGIFIGEMSQLTSLSGLSNISGVVAEIDVYDCPLLTDLSGLEGISGLAGFVEMPDYNTAGWWWGIYLQTNAALEDISALSGISGTVGAIGITETPSLQSLTPLSGITAIDLGYEDFPKGNTTLRDTALTSLEGLQNITYINGSLSIDNNNSLTDFGGPMALESVMSLWVRNNAVLVDFSGLENLTTVGVPGSALDWQNVRIYKNANLQNFNGLQNLAYIESNLHISENSRLTSILELERLTHTTSISASGAVLDACQSCTLNTQLNSPIDTLSSWCQDNCSP